ncbi:hypothetical protein HY633_03365 [Candidatus Uhrbacteria bacterium]|nr:hypothetical protein [Candidatus Uhrbacteria bacterium]
MRTKRFVSALPLLTSLVFIGAGCGQKAAVSTGAETATPAASGKPVSSDKCGNPYYPFKPGLAITYGTTPSVNADYTIRVISASGSTAAIRAEMAGGVAVEMQADCANGTVSMKGTLDLGAAAQGMKIKTTVVESSGTFMPASVAVGSAWSNSQTVKVEAAGGPGAIAGVGPITTVTTEKSKVLGEESVTVPAGTYRALKVEVTRTTTSKFSGLPAGLKLPEMPPSTATVTEWWVKGVGMVKSVTTGQGETSTVEAKSVTGL